MKKILVLLLTVSMIFTATACGGMSSEDAAKYKVAMLADIGGVDDQSFNQNIYEGCKEFCDQNNVKYDFYEAKEDSDDVRSGLIKDAIEDGYNVLILAGYSYAKPLLEAAEEHKDIKFIAIDIAQSDLGENYIVPQNVYCATYKEELAGFMAGYAAVKMGYKKLGFLGGTEVPAVQRYGYGYVQGADFAATELKLKDVKINYVYAGTFEPSKNITKNMKKWYKNGTEVVFACGGKLYEAVAEAAAKSKGKMIGVDVNQAPIIDKYAKGTTITSATKALGETVKLALDILAVNATWSEYAGQVLRMGLISDKHPETNYVQLSMEGTQWNDSFSEDDYKELVKKLYKDEIQVSSDVETEPVVKAVKVDYQGSLK